MDDKKFLLSFAGNKTELHTALKVWCARSEKNMNDTIIELIERHLAKKSKKLSTVSGD